MASVAICPSGQGRNTLRLPSALSLEAYSYPAHLCLGLQWVHAQRSEVGSPQRSEGRVTVQRLGGDVTVHRSEGRVTAQRSEGGIFPQRSEGGPTLPQPAPSRARTLEAGKRWARLAQARARTRGSLRSSSCLGRKPPWAPQLEETPETPPSSRPLP